MHSGSDVSGTGLDGRFDALWRDHRFTLVDLAYKMLGNFGDAEDAVQEAFSRLLRADIDAIDDVRGWLIVVVSRLCVDQLRSARRRRVDLGTDWEAIGVPPMTDAADRVSLDDDIRMALVVVLQQLTPAERAVFVLHDIFGFTFATASDIVGRTPEACRQLAARARRRIQAGTAPSRFEVQPADEHRLVERFIAACEGGDLSALMELLDPDVVGDVDLGGSGASRPPLVGRHEVAPNVLRYFGTASRVTLLPHPINGKPGALAFRSRNLFALVTFGIRGAAIIDLHAIVDPQKLALVSRSS